MKIKEDEIELLENFGLKKKELNQVKIEITCPQCKNLFEISYRYYIVPSEHLCPKCRFSKSYKQGDKKRRKTLLEKYGVDHNLKIEFVQEKQKKTFIEKYGVDNPWKSSICRQRGKNTSSEKYGDKNYNNQEKKKETMMKKYGVSHQMNVPNIVKKIKQTNLKKYGAEFQIASKQTKEKIKKVMLERYGRYVLRKFYEMDGEVFDSSWELCYYIWLRDAGIEFKYNPGPLFKYEGDDGKIHEYFPDFKIGETFQEIKGGQFFNEEGKPVNRYNGKSWEKKLNAMISHGVELLKFEDIKFAIQYVHKTYGKCYEQKFKYKSVGKPTKSSLLIV
jgi:rubredoxin